MGLHHSPKIVTNGLVLALDAGNTKSYPGSGTSWTDISGQGNNGTLTNGPTYSSTNGGSLSFDGVDDYIDLTTLTSDLQNSTISFWIKFSELNKYFLRISAGVGYYQWYVFTDGKLQFELSRTTPSVSAATIQGTVGDVSTNIWYNLSVTVSSSGTNFMYRNGVQIATGSWTVGAISPTGIRRIGSYTSGSINSNIANVCLYTRALSANEIAQNFNALRGRFGV